jgi:hypothetical protein
MGGSLFMMWTARENVESVGRLLTAQPQKMQQIIFTLTDSEKRNLFLYAGSELNRFYSNNWEWVQLALGVVILAILVSARQSKELIIMASVMLVTVLACHFLLTPQLIGLGRMFDFGPADQFAAERRQHASIQNLYTAMDVVKLLLGIALTVQLLKRGSDEKRRRRSGKVDEIQYPNYGHVDG